MRGLKLLQLVTILMLFVPVSGFTQDCMIAAYGDPGGTRSIMGYYDFEWDQGYWTSFSVYVVLFAEDTVAAAAYKFYFSSMNVEVFMQNRVPGADGQGLILDEQPATIGTNVALVECVIGFGGVPVLIERYDFVAAPGWWRDVVELQPNTNQDPDFPQYVTCNDVRKDCAVGPVLILDPGNPSDAKSFSSIKSLFHR
jgi:hypothetical protein